MQSFKEHLLTERKLTAAEEKKKEEIVKSLKNKGDDIDSIHAVATAQAKKSA